MTYQEQDLMTQYFQTLDLTNVDDWSVLFSTHKDFCNALHNTKHVMHEQAKKIKANKNRNLNFNNSFDAGTQRQVDYYYSNLPKWAK